MNSGTVNLTEPIHPSRLPLSSFLRRREPRRTYAHLQQPARRTRMGGAGGCGGLGGGHAGFPPPRERRRRGREPRRTHTPSPAGRPAHADGRRGGLRGLGGGHAGVPASAGTTEKRAGTSTHIRPPAAARPAHANGRCGGLRGGGGGHAGVPASAGTTEKRAGTLTHIRPPAAARPAHADGRRGGAQRSPPIRPSTRGATSTPRPTASPRALYECANSASGGSSDLVLDPFAGCATTLIATEWRRPCAPRLRPQHNLSFRQGRVLLVEGLAGEEVGL